MTIIDYYYYYCYYDYYICFVETFEALAQKHSYEALLRRYEYIALPSKLEILSISRYEYIALPSELVGFFRPVGSDILALLRERQCILTSCGSLARPERRMFYFGNMPTATAEGYDSSFGRHKGLYNTNTYVY